MILTRHYACGFTAAFILASSFTTLAANAVDLPNRFREEKPAIPNKLPIERPTGTLADNRVTDIIRLVLKLEDNTGAAVRRGVLYTRDTKRSGLVAALERINRLVNKSGGKLDQALPVPAGTLTKRRQEAQQNTLTKLADLTQYFGILLPKDSDVEDLLKALSATDFVQFAYKARPKVVDPGDYAPDTGSFVYLQSYSAAAPLGIDVDYVDASTDITAAGVTIADVEQCWTLTHEDLQDTNSDANVLVGEVPDEDFDLLGVDCSHGTAVLGILAADVDNAGVDGLVSEARFRVATVDDGNTGGGPLGQTSALSVLAFADDAPLQSGDVILIEQQTGGPSYVVGDPGCFGCLPVEYDQLVYDVIRQITAANIHVVEAGANGSQNLDNFSEFRFTNKYSGAIIAGAASADVQHNRLDFSSYGNRVDAFSWGEDIATTGYGPNVLPNNLFIGAPDANQWYTGSFGGTSGSSPIVTAAVALLQAQHVDLHGADYMPDALRLLLRTTGTPSSDPSEWIGHQPDLKLQTELVRSGPNLASVIDRDSALNGVMGDAIAYIGDQDNDNFGDFAAAQVDPLGGDVALQIYSGISGQLINSIPLPGLGYGLQTVSLANAGDVNGDGRDDLLIGQSSTSVPADGKVMVMTTLWATPSIFRTYSGETGSRFGYSVAAIDDLNGDGQRDFLVGAPNEAAHGGALYILSGASSNTLLDKKFGPPESHYGHAVTVLADWNGDGLRDFAVSAPDDTYGSYGQIGRVFIYDGPSRSLVDLHYCHIESGERCGVALADGGDLTDDGKSEILIGAPGFLNSQGSVLAFSYDYGYVTSWSKLGANGFGTSLVSVDCANCTSGKETFVGSPGLGTHQPTVHRLPGVVDVVTDDYVSPNQVSGYGSALAGGDVNYDGIPDLIIGDSGSNRLFVHLQ